MYEWANASSYALRTTGTHIQPQLDTGALTNARGEGRH